LITGQVDRRREESEERKRAEEEKKREEEEEKRGKRPGLIGGVRGMITQHAGMKQDQGLIKGIKSMGMQTVGLLYLEFSLCRLTIAGCSLPHDCQQ
jgi:hypothetical protein